MTGGAIGRAAARAQPTDSQGRPEVGHAPPGLLSLPPLQDLSNVFGYTSRDEALSGRQSLPGLMSLSAERQMVCTALRLAHLHR
jgi:hypothetical protein